MNVIRSRATAKPGNGKARSLSPGERTAMELRLPIDTAIGTFIAHYGPAGLCGLDFPTRSRRGAEERDLVSGDIARWHEITTLALRDVLAGRSPGKLPPIDLSSGTKFQQSVWRAMLDISCGQTKSYGEVARAIGRPRAVRAVGAACGANPIPVLIPCHRVLAANKMIGGFSAGLDWKRKLLAIESPGLFD